MITHENFWMYWFLIGIVYVVVNGAVRRIYTDGDWMLPTVHLCLGPAFVFVVIPVRLFSRYVLGHRE